MLAVSIVLYRTPLEHVCWAGKALVAQTRRPNEVLVHINSAAAGDVAEVEAMLAELPIDAAVTASADNLGFSGGHNANLATLFGRGHDVVVVHNPDLALDPDALQVLEAAASEKPMCLLGPVLELVDPATLAAEGRIDTAGIRWTSSGRHLDISQGRSLNDAPVTPREAAGISGACLVVPRAAYERIVAATGEFFDDDFIAYREDAELGLRAGLVGVPSYVVPTACGRHARRLRGTARRSDPHIDRLGVRNRFLLAFKYGRRRPGFAPAVLLRDALVIGGVVVRERSSLPGLREAWQLRHAMRAKRRRLRAVTSSRD